MSGKRSKESVAVFMLLMGMKAGGRIEKDAAEKLDQIIDEAFAALEAKLSKMERERDLYRQIATFKDAKSISFSDRHDYGLAIYTLRDLPLTKEFELDELAWAHHAQGNTSKDDWEYFRDEWLKRWREALAGGDEA